MFSPEFYTHTMCHDILTEIFRTAGLLRKLLEDERGDRHGMQARAGNRSKAERTIYSEQGESNSQSRVSGRGALRRARSWGNWADWPSDRNDTAESSVCCGQQRARGNYTVTPHPPQTTAQKGEKKHPEGTLLGLAGNTIYIVIKI